MVSYKKNDLFCFAVVILMSLLKEIEMQSLQKYKWNRRLLIISGKYQHF